MTPKQHTRLTDIVMRKRQALGLSVAELARRAGLDVATVWHIETGTTVSPKAETLQAIGDALGIPASDLFAAAGWVAAQELPTMRPYLRTKYRQLPPAAVNEIEAHFTDVARRYGISFDQRGGPVDGEDE
ncbi:helix-turn-helix domain-containing protein [Mycolicibacterium wolinskyi]|uniref:helix-turn-helix domain-containing protein n=1 Tax=Mycolicibacterium wolinskyi TaxID=59750 RepID=UPI003917966A